MNLQEQMIEAIKLVRYSIGGERKGSDEPQYLHSIRVGLLLKDSSPKVRTAGILHDILEDTPITPNELLEMGFDKEIIDLVIACTHNNSIEDPDDRWLDMIGKISGSNNYDAIAIKTADLIDNLRSAHLLRPDRFEAFVTVKAPVMLMTFWSCPLRDELENVYLEQCKRLSKIL